MDQNLAGRVTRLERENRRLRLVGLMATALLGGMFLLGQAAPKEIPKEIRAEKFIAVDEKGKSRARLGPTGFALLDDMGDPAVVLGSVHHGQRVLAFLDKGLVKLGLHQPDDDGSFLGIPDDNGKLGAMLAVKKNGIPRLVLTGPGGEVIWESSPKEE